MADFNVPIQSCVEFDPGDMDPEPIRLIHQYWRKKCGRRWAPRWSDIDLMDIAPPLLPYITVMDVLDDGGLLYRYWGRGHTTYYGHDYTGEALSSVRPAWARDLLGHQIARVFETQTARVFVVRYDKILQAVSSIRLPLSDDGERVTGILGFSDRKGVSEDLRFWIGRRQPPKVEC